MAEASIFQIEDGVLAFTLVDTAEVGYLPEWNAPGGAAVADAVEADYDTGSATWKCQVTSGMLTPTADDTSQDVPATFCSPSKTIPTPGVTSYTLDAEFLQDAPLGTADVATTVSLSQFLFENDTNEAYFLLGLNGDAAPKAVGRVRIQAGAFGGAARATLTATVSLPLSQKPDIAWGNAAPVVGAASEPEPAGV